LAEISAAQVKELRERTGAGMMDCKKALLEARGDVARAQDVLRERGLVKARAKLGRSTSEGMVAASLSPDARSGLLLEVNCETDFVAKTEEFRSLVRDLAELAREKRAADVEALLRLRLDGGSASDRVTQAIARLGENIRVRRLARLETGPKGLIGSYVHAGGKIASLVEIETDDPSSPGVRTFAKNLCMHVTALQPLAVRREELPADEVEREKAVLRKQSEQEGKPPGVVEKMVEGRLRKYYAEVVLLEQLLVTDPEKRVEAAAKEVGARVKAFRRLQLGEELPG
jgi:elongation factor Ts